MIKPVIQRISFPVFAVKWFEIVRNRRKHPDINILGITFKTYERREFYNLLKDEEFIIIEDVDIPPLGIIIVLLSGVFKMVLNIWISLTEPVWPCAEITSPVLKGLKKSMEKDASVKQK